MLRNNESDEELMVAYQGGSEDAFKALYSRHSGKIYGYLRQRTSSEAEAADLLQDVFIKIHRSKHLYNQTLPLLPWIFSVTHSVLIDQKRKVERKKEVFGVDFDQIPVKESLHHESIALVTPLMKDLPENQQVALQMRYLDEKTFEEIAERLRTSPLNVRQIISRGVKNIKRLIKEGDNS